MIRSFHQSEWCGRKPQEGPTGTHRWPRVIYDEAWLTGRHPFALGELTPGMSFYRERTIFWCAIALRACISSMVDTIHQSSKVGVLVQFRLHQYLGVPSSQSRDNQNTVPGSLMREKEKTAVRFLSSSGPSTLLLRGINFWLSAKQIIWGSKDSKKAPCRGQDGWPSWNRLVRQEIPGTHDHLQHKRFPVVK